MNDTNGVTSEQQSTFQGEGGIKLFARKWLPQGRPRASVIIVHGFLSHSGLYEWPAAKLVQAGFAVYAFDLRGHGHSDGERFYVEKFEDYVADLEKLVALERSQEPKLPLFLLAHSAGGVVASLYALDHQAELAGLISESFAFELPVPGIALTLLSGLSHIAPHAHVMGLKADDFSRDAKFVEAMKEDPLIYNKPGPTQTVAATVHADKRLADNMASLELPVLVMHGTADKVTNPHGSQRFFDGISSTDKTLKLYDGHFHDMLNDVGREEVMADILGWLKARSQPLDRPTAVAMRPGRYRTPSRTRG